MIEDFSSFGLGVPGGFLMSRLGPLGFVHSLLECSCFSSRAHVRLCFFCGLILFACSFLRVLSRRTPGVPGLPALVRPLE